MNAARLTTTTVLVQHHKRHGLGRARVKFKPCPLVEVLQKCVLWPCSSAWLPCSCSYPYVLVAFFNLHYPCFRSTIIILDIYSYIHIQVTCKSSRDVMAHILHTGINQTTNSFTWQSLVMHLWSSSINTKIRCIKSIMMLLISHWFLAFQLKLSATSLVEACMTDFVGGSKHRLTIFQSH